MSLAQVAGSAVAAVAAAVLASRLGVYGTIAGAGVVSVVATAGGPFFQHVFRRTGQRLGEVAAAGRGGARGACGDGPRPGEYGAATTYGTRLRGWRRPAVATAAVFALAMGALTGIEWLSGGPVSDVWGRDDGGTTLSRGVRGGFPDRAARPDKPRPAPSPGPSDPSAPAGRSRPPAPSGPGGATPSPGPSGPGTGSPMPGPTPDASPSHTPGGDGRTSAPAPEPTPDGPVASPDGGAP
ncbi:hypothetical protein RKE29_13710 [Streptomyces sp. B1866]|uniref:hypothetical protein n=1 Tax=Streptomyces sp. B1866 TaxID=3075431 RepID=UPI002890A8DE|nr:hypothetical protein [Streptomyces sp. B1866]MDT3397693.1 hypothetical protein [Streptomyces sp. B1866]